MVDYYSATNAAILQGPSVKCGMLLYKYCDPGGIEILRSGTILLKRPRAFNDPFDLNPFISKFDDPAAMGDYVFEKLKDIVVLSLAENCDSLLMWAHYADQHRGFLIGFRGNGRIVDDGLLYRRFEAVSYGHHRPTAERMKQLTEQELYFRKSSEWSYEREWRIVTSIIPVENDIDGAAQKARFAFPLVTRDVQTVIVGHRASNLFPDLYNILREERYGHVSLRLAIPDLERYKLNIKHWPRSKWTTAPPILSEQA